MSPKADSWNLVAHYESGTSDKVYMACIRQTPAGYEVWGKWGRRGKNLSSMKKGAAGDLGNATRIQRELFNSKLKEGYLDVDSAQYRGPVDRSTAEIRDNLEAEPKSLAVPPKQAQAPKAKEPAGLPQDVSDMVAICVDRTGVEGRFDEGIEYVFEKHDDKKMIWVYDKLGKKAEYFLERFRVMKGS